MCALNVLLRGKDASGLGDGKPPETKRDEQAGLKGWDCFD
jgi:hypothetical protein